MRRLFVGTYGIVSYVLFFTTFLYLIGFIGNLWVPRSLDVGPQRPLFLAILINVGLISLFAVQHTIMARPGFKRWVSRYLPKEIERSNFVLATCAVLITMFTCWSPISIVLWDVSATWSQWLLYALFVSGWLIVLGSTFLINHFDLFGLRQTLLYAAGKPYTPLKFGTPWLYRIVRHPLYVGMLIAFWVTPVMTLGHLLFAGGMSIYILVGIQFEERDLVRAHGEDYLRYRESVPMLVPMPIRRAEKASSSTAT